MRHLRNASLFAAGVAPIAALAVGVVAIPAAAEWGQIEWSVLAVVLTLYTALYALSALALFALAQAMLRRPEPIARGHLLMLGAGAGLIFLIGGLLLDPITSEDVIMVAWFGVASAAAIGGLLRWGRPA